MLCQKEPACAYFMYKRSTGAGDNCIRMKAGDEGTCKDEIFWDVYRPTGYVQIQCKRPINLIWGGQRSKHIPVANTCLDQLSLACGGLSTTPPSDACSSLSHKHLDCSLTTYCGFYYNPSCTTISNFALPNTQTDLPAGNQMITLTIIDQLPHHSITLPNPWITGQVSQSTCRHEETYFFSSR